MTLDELKRFCAEDHDPRVAIQSPWTRDGYTWATNGHILVRVPTMAGVADNDRAPNAQKLWDKQLAPTGWMSVPKMATPAPIECDVCHGDGVHECSNPRCNEEHRCGHCDGVGTVKDFSGAKVGDAWFQKRYLAMIKGWEIAPNGPVKAAWIRNGDAMGLLMPKSGEK